jgi:hypothetical protein
MTVCPICKATVSPSDIGFKCAVNLMTPQRCKAAILGNIGQAPATLTASTAATVTGTVDPLSGVITANQSGKAASYYTKKVRS